MPFPTTGILDNFNRANEGPPPTGWTAWISPGMLVSTNQMAPQDAGDNGAYWSTSMTGPDVEAWITIATQPGTASPCASLVAARLDPAGGGSVGNCYAVQLNNLSGTDTVQIISVAASVNTVLATFNQEMGNGHKLGIQCIGSVIHAWADVGGGWIELGNVTDTTWAGTGNNNKIGVYNKGDASSAAARYDDFGGGVYVPPAGGASIPGPPQLIVGSGVWR